MASDFPMRRWIPWIAGTAGLALIATLLLWNLGTYALWDDEANTAAFAASVWKTGDTTAWDGMNIIAYRGGFELSGIKNRVIPPLQYFCAAPFLGLLGRNAWAARLPFALAALLGFILWGYWLRQARASWPTITLTSIFVVGNVSLFLYSRQSRYYSLAWTLALALTYFYVNRHASRRNRVLFALASVALLSCHYFTYGATMVCLAVDYLCFETRRGDDTWKQRVLYCVTQVVGLIVIVGIFWPFGRAASSYQPTNWWDDKLTLFWWNLRNIDMCEFVFLPLMALALAVGVLRRDRWLVRGVVALVVFAFATSVLSNQPVGKGTVAEVRYLVPIIPLCIFLSARTLVLVLYLDCPSVRARTGRALVGIAVAAFLSLSNIAHSWTQALFDAPVSIIPTSALWVWLHELARPQRSAYAEASAWLNANVPPGRLAFALPDYATYPLMFHAPRLRYMWQFDDDKRASYPMLAEHNFRFHGIPDVIVAFGHDVVEARKLVAYLTRPNVHYEPEVRLGVCGPDSTRPELFLRAFATEKPADPETDGTFIFLRVH